MKKGVFYGVGIGPGDPELLTLKAVRVLQECRVIAAPRTKSGEMLALDIAKGAVNLDDKCILPLYFAMERDSEALHRVHLAAAEEVRAHLDAGEDVAMLNLGDVSIYSTWSYLMEILQAEGYETVMVPGIPSFCAVAARLGISLTEMNSAMHIAPGSSKTEEVLALPGTKILMKSGKQLPAVLDRLRTTGQIQRSALIKNCGLAGEEVYPDLAEAAPGEDAGYFVTLVVKD